MRLGTSSRRGFLGITVGAVGGAVIPAAAAAAERTATLLVGKGSPSRHLGRTGSYYLDQRADALYGPKRATGWGAPTSLKRQKPATSAKLMVGVGPTGPRGTTGARGATGSQGATGPQGRDGYAVLHGAGPPSSSQGQDGDFYIDTASTQIYGPRSGGAWGSPVALTADGSALLSAAATPDAMFVGTISRASSGAPLSASVVWPDGIQGSFTGVESTDTPGALDSYSVTYLGSTRRTFSQPPITRDANGYVVSRPDIQAH